MLHGHGKRHTRSRHSEKKVPPMTGQHSVLKIQACIAVLLTISAGWPACKPAPHDNRAGDHPTPGQTQRGLGPGWHLLTLTPEESLASLIGDASYAAWQIDHAYNKHRGALEPRYLPTHGHLEARQKEHPSTGHEPHSRMPAQESYWVHVQGEVDTSSEAETVPPDLHHDFGPEGRFFRLRPGEVRFTVSRAADRVYRWNARSQTMTRMEPGALNPHETYWLVAEDDCEAGNWNHADALRFVQTCAFDDAPFRLMRAQKSDASVMAAATGPLHPPQGTQIVVQHHQPHRPPLAQMFEAQPGHFVIAQDARSQWQVHERVPLGQSPALPKEIHVVLVAANEQPPPVGAVLRLGQLVAHLQSLSGSMGAQITGVAPFTSASDAIRAVGSLNRSEASHDLLRALSGRFFSDKTRNVGASLGYEPRAAPIDADTRVDMDTTSLQAGVFAQPGAAKELGPGTKFVRLSVSQFKKRGFQHANEESKRFTHVVQVVASQNESDEIQYRRSDRLANENSREPETEAVFKSSGSWSVMDIALATRGENIAIGWIEKAKQKKDDQPLKTRVRIVKSKDGGQNFDHEPKTLRSSEKSKRHIDLAYDKFGEIHLVWGEANKVYYLGGLDGVPSNVFDQHKRYPVDVSVDYFREYIVRWPDDHPSPCPCTKTEHEVYSLSQEQIRPEDLEEAMGCQDAYEEFPDLWAFLPSHPNGGLAYGPYFYRCEENYVTRPSLHIDDQRITIAAHQRLSWDNLPVKNPAWVAQHGPETPPRNSQDACQDPLEGRRRSLLGFRQTYKTHPLACDPLDPSRTPVFRFRIPTKSMDHTDRSFVRRGRFSRRRCSHAW